MDDGVGHAVFFGEFGADVGVFAFDFVSDGFAHVVEESGGFSDALVGANFFGDHAGHVGHFYRVQEDVLTVGRSELEFAEEMENFSGDANDANFAGCVFAGANDFFFDFFLALGDGFFNRSGINSAVFHEAFQSVTSDLATDRVEGAQDDHARGVVDDDVDASGALESLDVATLFADDATFHFVVREFEGGDGAVGGDFAGHAFHGS